jgi:cyclic pyranopterin phosphate synthase
MPTFALVMKKFTHLDKEDNPTMVDVGHKEVTERVAVARALISLDEEILDQLDNNEIQTQKGPIFQTAILAGIMATKKTSDLIPLCHPLAISKSSVDICVNADRKLEIDCTVKLTGKTGVEMEALTGASVAALTIYDMCKGFSHNIIIEQVQLMKKSGGKSDFERK